VLCGAWASPRWKSASPQSPVWALARSQATAGENTSLKLETADAGRANDGANKAAIAQTGSPVRNDVTAV
jgi:hypothetical protein